MGQVGYNVRPVVGMEEGVRWDDGGMAGVLSFGEASGGELMGVHLENSKEGVGVIIFLVPVWRGV